jgi:hypothetical protein
LADDDAGCVDVGLSGRQLKQGPVWCAGLLADLRDGDGAAD